MKNISTEEVRSRLAAGEKLQLVDVREPHENAEFNIGGLLLPLGKIMSMQTEEIDDWKNKELIFYCRSGNRSMQACMMLETFGFTDVKNLTGGMVEWQQQSGR